MAVRIAAAVLTAALVASPVANADASTYGYAGDRNGWAYMSELARDGWPYSEYSDVYQMGLSLCSQRAQGYSESQLVAKALRAASRAELGAYGVSPSDIAIDSVLHAEFHFCPQYLSGPFGR